MQMKQDRALNRISAAVKRYRHAMRSGDFDKAVAVANKLIVRIPGQGGPFACRAEAHFFAGKWQEAANDFGQAHLLDPDNPQFLVRFGDALESMGQREDAIMSYERALELDETNLEGLLGMGRALEALGRAREAASHILKAVSTYPDSARACHAAGRFMHYYGDRQDAAQFFAKSITNDPKLPNSYRVLASYLREATDYDGAIRLYDTLLQVLPDDPISLSERAHCLAHINDWESPGYADFDPATPEQLETGAVPFQFLPMEDDPANLLHRCKIYADRLLGGIRPTPLPRPSAHDRIRVGYFSADFHDHATMHLLAGMLESHDRSRFEICAYSFGPDRQDHMRARAIAAVDSFHDIRGMDDLTAAMFARSHELDIAVDLKGFTAGMRIGIFGHRVAPVQVTWLGFPGSTGAACMDAIIADDIVIPPELEQYYSERVINLPDCYQPNDQQRPIPDPAVTRASLGLPEDGVVFASFNNVYKISPAEFDIWMELLREVEGSVLWQLTGGAESVANLRKAAETRGVDPERLIFAPRLLQGPHLSRLAQADIFLDCFNCNAHTTASDALWAGVPVVTAPGRQFAARVAASLVSAAGTPETICESREAYRDCALRLARDPGARADLRERLIVGRQTSALFDTDRFTRNFEAALERLHTGG
jgi:protein O-GlcNAc transferase